MPNHKWRNNIPFNNTPLIDPELIATARDRRKGYLETTLIPHLTSQFYNTIIPGVPEQNLSAEGKKKFLDALQYIEAEKRYEKLERSIQSIDQSLSGKIFSKYHKKAPLLIEKEECDYIKNNAGNAPDLELRTNVENWLANAPSDDNYRAWRKNHDINSRLLLNRKMEHTELLSNTAEIRSQKEPTELTKLKTLLAIEKLPNAGFDQVDPNLLQRINLVNVHMDWLKDIKAAFAANPNLDDNPKLERALKEEYQQRMKMLKIALKELIDITNLRDGIHRDNSRLARLANYGKFITLLKKLDKNVNNILLRSNVKLPEKPKPIDGVTCIYVWEQGKRTKLLDPVTQKPKYFSDRVFTRALEEYARSGGEYTIKRVMGGRKYDFKSPEGKTKFLGLLLKAQQQEDELERKQEQQPTITDAGVQVERGDTTSTTHNTPSPSQ